MDDERDRSRADARDGAPDDDAIETAGTVATAGRRLITEDWAATIIGLLLLGLILIGVIGKGLVP